MARKKQKRQEHTLNPRAAMLERFLPLLRAEEVKALMKELEEPLYPSFRMNPLKVDQPDVVNKWAQSYQWQLKPVPFCETGFWVTDAPSPISKSIEHSLGHYYIQDAASMLPVELFDFNKIEEHPLILDMAASPGGKTTHLVSRTHDQALIIANDSSRERLTALRIVLQNWGSSHVAVTNYPGEYFGSWFPETFRCHLTGCALLHAGAAGKRCACHQIHHAERNQQPCQAAKQAAGKRFIRIKNRWSGRLFHLHIDSRRK